jgi:hypothetical protein
MQRDLRHASRCRRWLWRQAHRPTRRSLCGALDPRPYALSVNPDDNLAGIHQISCSSLELAKSACPNDLEAVAIAAGDCDVREALQGTKAGRILDLELQEPTRTPRSSVIAYLDSDAMGGCASDD